MNSTALRRAGTILSSALLALTTTVQPAGASEPAPSTNIPTAAIKPLTPLVGNWQCAGTLTNPGSPAADVTTRFTAAFALGGQWLESRVEHTVDGALVGTEQQWWGWNAATKQFTLDEYGSDGTRAAYVTSGWNGTTLNPVGSWRLASGTEIPARVTFTTEATEGTVLYEIQTGAVWTPVYDATCTKVA